MFPLSILISVFTMQNPIAAQVQPTSPGIHLFLQARNLQNQRKYTLALPVYQQFEATMGSSPELNLRLAECYKELGKLEKAWEKIQKAHELAPTQQEITIQWGLIAYARAKKENKFIPAARTVLKSATEKVPQEIELWGRNAELCESENDYSEALESWLNVVSLREDFIPAWQRILILSEQLNRYESQRQSVLYLVNQSGDQKSLQALETLANEQLKKNYLAHAEESYALLSQVLKVEPDSWEILGLIQLDLKKYSQALESFKTALTIRPSHRIRFATAQAEIKLNNYEEASKYLLALWDEIKDDLQNPLRKKTQTMLVYNWFLMERYNSLLEFVRSDQQNKGVDSIVAIHTFMSWVAKEDWREAQAQLRYLLNLKESEVAINLKELLPPSMNLSRLSPSPNLLRAISQRCRAEIHQSFIGEEASLALLRSSMLSELNPTATTFILESNCWSNLGKSTESIAALRKAMALDPKNTTILNNLGYALLDQSSSLLEASNLLEEAYRLRPEDEHILDSIGWLRFKQNRYAESEKLLLKAQSLNPQSFDVHVHLFECFAAQGRDEESLSALEVALALRQRQEELLLKRRDDLRRKLNLKKLQLTLPNP